MVPLSRRAEMAAQAFRARLIDLIRGRRDLAVYGQLTGQNQEVQGAEDRRLALRRVLDRTESRAGRRWRAVSLVAAGALGLGIQHGAGGPNRARVCSPGFFRGPCAGRVVAPLRRTVSDLGRMADAARRV
jgi:ATP-binding cassette, subfamily C, bacterial CydC